MKVHRQKLYSTKIKTSPQPFFVSDMLRLNTRKRLGLSFVYGQSVRATLWVYKCNQAAPVVHDAFHCGLRIIYKPPRPSGGRWHDRQCSSRPQKVRNGKIKSANPCNIDNACNNIENAYKGGCHCRESTCARSQHHYTP